MHDTTSSDARYKRVGLNHAQVDGLVDVLMNQGLFLRSGDGQLWFYSFATKDLILVRSDPRSTFYRLVLGLGYKDRKRSSLPLKDVIEQLIARADVALLQLPSGEPVGS